MATRELQDIGASAYECIVAMVKAVKCDWERLGEVREELEEIKEALEEEDKDPEERDELEDQREELEAELKELEEEAGDAESQEDADQRIQENPLSLEVRSDWHSPGGDHCYVEYRLCLGTGGPAVQLIGELDQHSQPDSAKLQAQDWGTPWETYEGADESILLEYASRFYFGE